MSNHVTVKIDSPVPPTEEIAEALGRHLWDLARECEQVGWKATITLTMTKTGNAAD